MTVAIRVLLAACLALPALSLPGVSWHPHVAPKVLGVRILAAFLLAGCALHFLRARPRPRLSAIHVAVAVFFASFVVSAFAGIDLHRSVWGGEGRMLGLVTMAAFAVFYLAAAAVPRGWRDRRLLFRVLLGAGAFVFVVAIAQSLGVVPGTYRGAPVSTLGDPLALAGFASACVFFGALLVAKEEAPAWRRFAGSVAALALVTVFLTGSSATVAGVVAGGAMAAAGYRMSMKERTRRRVAIDVALAAVVLSLVGLWLVRDEAWIAETPVLEHAAELEFDLERRDERAYLWGIGALSNRHRRVAGLGPDNYYHAYNFYYVPGVLRFGPEFAYADAPKSAAVNALAERGIAGAIAFVLLFGVPLVVLVRRYDRGLADVPTAALGIGFLTAHALHSMAAPMDTTSYLAFLLFLAFVNGIGEEEGESDAPAGAGAIAVAGALAVAGAWYVGVAPALTNVAQRTALASADHPGRALARYEAATDRASPHDAAFHAAFAPVAVECARALVEDGRPEEARELLQASSRRLAESWGRTAARYANDVRVAVREAEVALERLELLDDRDALEDAEAHLGEAVDFDWNGDEERQHVLFAMARLLAARRQALAAVTLAESAKESEEAYADGWWELARVYHAVGRSDDARATVQAAEAAGLVFSDEGRRFVERLGAE